MELRSITLDDLPLYESLRSDPQMMAELGGPAPKENLPEKVRRDVESVKDGTAWIFNVVPNPESGEAAGQVCIWESEFQGVPINEIGWMILPAFQGQGLATKAVRALLTKARAEKRWDVIHAFPAVTNGASNALCRKLGFSNAGVCELEYAGDMLHCNHWRLELS